jgi:hypothetical protein
MPGRGARLILACVLTAAAGLPLWADAGPPPKKERRGILLRIDATRREGGGGWLVAMERAFGSGRTAEFESTIGLRLGAEFEVASGFWLKANIGYATPTLEITSYDRSGEPRGVERGTVVMTPFLVGFEFHPKQWRGRRLFWGIGLHYGWVRYGALPSDLDADLESTEETGGFDVRLDVRLGKSRWMVGAEFGTLLSSPSYTDHQTGAECRAHFDGASWAVGFSRFF